MLLRTIIHTIHTPTCVYASDENGGGIRYQGQTKVCSVARRKNYTKHKASACSWGEQNESHKKTGSKNTVLTSSGKLHGTWFEDLTSDEWNSTSGRHD